MYVTTTILKQIEYGVYKEHVIVSSKIIFRMAVYSGLHIAPLFLKQVSAPMEEPEVPADEAEFKDGLA